MSGIDSSDWETTDDESDDDDREILEYFEEQRRGRLRKALIVQKRRISVRSRLGPKGPNKVPRLFSWEEHVSDMNEEAPPHSLRQNCLFSTFERCSKRRCVLFSHRVLSIMLNPFELFLNQCCLRAYS